MNQDYNEFKPFKRIKGISRKQGIKLDKLPPSIKLHYRINNSIISH